MKPPYDASIASGPTAGPEIHSITALIFAFPPEKPAVFGSQIRELAQLTKRSPYIKLISEHSSRKPAPGGKFFMPVGARKDLKPFSNSKSDSFSHSGFGMGNILWRVKQDQTLTEAILMKALALLSGGLDSMLAVKTVQEAGIEVEAINFTSPFCRCSGAAGGCGAAASAASQLGIKLHYQGCGEDYLRLVEDPPHGYGRRMNPCLDCRIHKFQLAKQKMDEIGASFLVTGEVVDQRPNSQRKDALDIVERDSGLRGYILRPLSAKHLRPTIPEEQGWIDRQRLLDIKGRGRRQQMDLAEGYGLDYPCPAGGCLLTYEEYSQKIKDLIRHNGRLDLRSVNLLRFGRQLRLSPEVKIFIGKDEAENGQLRNLAQPQDYLLEAPDVAGPVTLYVGPRDERLLNLAAAMTAGYASVQPGQSVAVQAAGGAERLMLEVQPMPRPEIRNYFIYHVE
jgi:tRNA U34 2-thiouridine synthase MnmA/TrmU